MNRHQRKCLIVSAGLHLTLMLVLLVGPAFLVQNHPAIDAPPLDIIPGKLVDDLLWGGGNPNGQRPPPTPTASRPAPVATPTAPEPQTHVQPEPPKHHEPQPEAETEKEPAKPAKEPRIDPDSLEPAKPAKPHKPEIDLGNIIQRPKHNTKHRSTKPQPDADDTQEEARERANNLRRMADGVASAAYSLRSELSSGTALEVFGPGGGGEVYGNYAQAVISAYWDAWDPPQAAYGDDTVTKAVVTIASDGRVVSARIVRRSGDPELDASVQRALDRVTSVAAFPEGAKEKERTYPINFKPKNKR